MTTITKDFKKDCIQDFCDAWQAYDRKSTNYIADRNWDLRFRDAGYYGVGLGTKSDRGRRELHKWCEEQVGKKHYAWTGTAMFWFETEQAAVLFALRWS